MRRARRTVLAALVALALAALFADEPARWLVLTDPPRTADAALVLAGDPDYERTKAAARMLLEGHVRLLIVTGGEPGPGDSAESLRDTAIRAGVPPGRIRMERLSRSTHEAMEAVRPILEREGIRSLAVVTSPYHQRRAAWAARQALPGIDVVSRPADPSGWKPDGWWRTRRSRRIVLGEYAKLIYYLIRGWA
jgi:uncharacterized SAM-binding protein YcdF (DUF218 family)